MIVDRFKLIKGTVIFLAALLVVSVLLGYALVSSISKVFAFPAFLHLYFKKSDIKGKSFIGFLLFSISVCIVFPKLAEAACVFISAHYVAYSLLSIIGFYFYMESDPRLIETARYCLKI